MISTILSPSQVSNDGKLCAAVSVFKNLYDSKKNIRDVLQVFINYVIKEKGLHNFTAYDVKSALLSQFYFDIPEAVIRSILKKQINYTLSNGVFSLINNFSGIDMVAIDKQITNAAENNSCVIADLLNYVKANFDSSFTDDEKKELVESLYNFLMDKSMESKYTSIVSAYIVSIENDRTKQEILSNIKEGILLYEGIKYTSDLNEISKWGKKLTIFCDVDILFSYYGLNGSIYKELISELMNLINESNNKSTKHEQISLFYFSKTKKEIESYFHKAEIILENHEPIDPSRTAMVSILNGCKTASDVVERKTKFFSFLKNSRIYEYNKMENFYEDSSNNKYVLNLDTVVDSIIEKYDGVTTSMANDYFDYLNYINALREGRSGACLEQAGYIFLTSNRKITSMALSVIAEGTYEISKAINPDDLINRLWFKLNKGLGSKILSSISVVTKARILIASQLNTKVSDGYDNLCQKMKKGDINQKAAVEILIELKKEVKKPEEVTVESIDNSIEFLICEDNIQERVFQQKTLEQKLTDAQRELAAFSNDNAKKDKLIEEKENEIMLMKKELEDKKKQEEERISCEIKKKKNRKRLFCGFAVLTLSAIVVIAIIYVSVVVNNAVLTITGWVFGVIGVIISILSFCGGNIHTIVEWVKNQ